MTDNEFIIDTEINTADAEKGLDALSQKYEEMGETIDKLKAKEQENVRKTVQAYQEQAKAVESQKSKIDEIKSKNAKALAEQVEAIDTQKAKIDELKSKLTEMQELQGVNPAYKSNMDEIDKLEKRLQKLKEAREDDLETGGKDTTKGFKKREIAIRRITEAIRDLKLEQEEMLKKGTAYNQSEDTSKLESQIANAEGKLRKMETSLNDKANVFNSKIDNEEEKLSKLQRSFKDKAIALKIKLDTIEAENEGKTIGQRIAETIGRGLKAGGKGIAHILGATIKGAVKGVRGTITSFGKHIQSTFKKAGDSTKHSFKNLLRYTLGIRSMFMLVRKLRTALVDGFKSLAQFNNGNNDTNKSISLLKNSLGELKNAFAGAFAPVLTVIAPAINNLVQTLISGVNALGMFIAKLNGMTTFTKAKKLTDDYAKSLNKAKNSLYAFDELNVVNKDGGGTSPNNMFEVAEVDGGVSTFVDKLKEAFANGDLSEIGQTIGDKIFEGLNNIDLSGGMGIAEKLGSSIATLMNGIINTEGLGNTIGTKIGEGFNVALRYVSTLLGKLDFKGLGKQFGGLINGIGTTVDFNELGKTLGDGFKGVLDFLNGAVQEIDWQQLGENVREFLTGIDWGGIVASFFELLGSAVGGLGAFLWGIIKAEWEDLMGWWQDTAFEDGEFTIEGLLDGIWEKIEDIGKWIYDHIFKPFWDGICEAFDIHSPSKVMKEIGEYIVQGLFDGITGLIDTVVEIWQDFKEDVLDIFEKLWDGLKSILNTIINGVEKMVNSVINGLNGMIDLLNKLKFDIPDWVPSIGGKTFGLNIPTVSNVNLPRLATGTVVPRTAKEFTAILGDNNQEAEVVSPLSTMKEAFMEAMAESGANRGGDVYISANGDLDALIRLLNLKIEDEKNRTGKQFRKVVTV